LYEVYLFFFSSDLLIDFFANLLSFFIREEDYVYGYLFHNCFLRMRTISINMEFIRIIKTGNPIVRIDICRVAMIDIALLIPAIA